MKVYSFNPITKEYAGESNATKDPLMSIKRKKDVWTLPANSTQARPPKTKKNEVATWDINSNRWSKRKDFRGTTYWTKKGVENEITEIGKGIPKDAVLEEPIENITVADYTKKRQVAYGFITDQLDMLYWDMMKGTTKWKNHISRVKKKYRKVK